MIKLFKLSIALPLTLFTLAHFLSAEPFKSTYTPLPSKNLLIKNANIYDGEGNEFLQTDLLILELLQHSSW